MPEPGRSGTRHSAEDTREVALIGEATLGSDRGKRPFRIAQQNAGGSQLQALLIFSGRPLLHAAEDARQVYGMNSGFPCQIAHAEGFAESFVQAVLHAITPSRGRFL